MKQIISIGFNIPSNEGEDYVNIDSLYSLSDVDIAVFSPNLSDACYRTTSGGFQGYESYDHESSIKIKEHSKHWQQELLHFVENGGTLFITLCKKEKFFIYSGEKKYEGTGRNRKTINIVNEYSNYKYFDSIIQEHKFSNMQGRTIVPTSSIAQNLFKDFNKYFFIETYLVNDKRIEEIFTSKKKDRTFGGIIKIGKGYVLLIPNLQLDKSINKDDPNEWSEKALKEGIRLKQCLVEMDNALKSESKKTPKPDWLEEETYNLENVEKTKIEITKKKQKLKSIQKEISSLELQLEQEEQLKDLLFETGTPLEDAVRKALRILGYQAEGYDNGELELDQVITSPEGHRFIGECEGKENKDIDISKFRQLSESLNADFAREDIDEKAFGLLIGNSQRLLSPKERTLFFTKKCQTGAERDKIGLIKTVDLFYIARYLQENEDIEFAKKCREAVYNQLGQIIKFPVIPDQKDK